MTHVRGLGLCVAACVLTACQTMPARPAADTSASPATTPMPATPSAPRSTPKPPRTPVTPAQPEYLQDIPATPNNGGEFFDRLVGRFADPTCPRDHLVRRWETIYARSPTRFSSHLEDALPLMTLVLEEAERYHLPGELVLLPIVESWYRADAGAGSGHVGLWQFGAPTARGLGLPVRNDYDARMAPFASTDAAFRHLAQLHNRFGDWKLANMGFNAGAYRMQKILEKTPPARISASDRQPAGLSPITYEHLAKVQALACLIAQPERFDVQLPRQAQIEALTTVDLPAGTSTLAAIARASNTDATWLARANPAFRRGVVTAQADRELLVPLAQAERFAQFELPVVAIPAAAPGTAASADGVHIIRSGDTLGAIAKRYRVRVRDLLTWNGLSAGSVLRLGQRIKLEQ